MRYRKSGSNDGSSLTTSLEILLGGGDEDFIASSQQLARTSSRTPVFFLGIRSKFGEKPTPGAAAYGNIFECTPSLDLLIGAGSVRMGELWFDLRSI